MLSFFLQNYQNCDFFFNVLVCSECRPARLTLVSFVSVHKLRTLKARRAGLQVGLGLRAQDSEDTPARGWQGLHRVAAEGQRPRPNVSSVARGLCPVGWRPQVPAGHTVVPVPAADPRDFRIVLFLLDRTGGNFPAAPA